MCVLVHVFIRMLNKVACKINPRLSKSKQEDQANNSIRYTVLLYFSLFTNRSKKKKDQGSDIFFFSPNAVVGMFEMLGGNRKDKIGLLFVKKRSP